MHNLVVRLVSMSWAYCGYKLYGYVYGIKNILDTQRSEEQWFYNVSFFSFFLRQYIFFLVEKVVKGFWVKILLIENCILSVLKKGTLKRSFSIFQVVLLCIKEKSLKKKSKINRLLPPVRTWKAFFILWYNTESFLINLLTLTTFRVLFKTLRKLLNTACEICI